MGMPRKAARKALWVTKGAALFGGAVVTLALVLGVGTMALAAVPGNPFKLGKTNTISNATTQLVGSIKAPMLTITNQSDGRVCGPPATERLNANAPGEPPTSPGPGGPSCSTSPAPALGLEVRPGQTPLTVNPQAGTAKGLSADELDGKDSSEFLSSGTYDESLLLTGDPNEVNLGAVQCDEGDAVLSGGYGLMERTANVIEDEPDTRFESWSLRWTGDDQVRITVLCADLPPLR